MALLFAVGVCLVRLEALAKVSFLGVEVVEAAVDACGGCERAVSFLLVSARPRRRRRFGWCG